MGRASDPTQWNSFSVVEMLCNYNTIINQPLSFTVPALTFNPFHLVVLRYAAAATTWRIFTST